MGMCLPVTVRAHMQFNSKLVVKSHTDVLMWDQSGHQLVPLWQSWISFYRPAVTMAWQVCFHGNTFVTSVEHGQSVGGESPMRTVGLEGKLITLMMIQSLSSGRMRKSLLLLGLSVPPAAENFRAASGFLSTNIMLQKWRMACTNGNANAIEMCENNVVIFLQDELNKRSGVVHHCKMELLFCESLVFLLLTKWVMCWLLFTTFLTELN